MAHGGDSVTIRYRTNIKKKVGRSKETLSKSLSIQWDSSWLLRPSNGYESGLAVASMALCQASYGNTASNGCVYLSESLGSLGFQDLDLSAYDHRTEEDPTDYETLGIDIAAYGFGRQRLLLSSGEQTDLVVVVVRGTTPTVEWNSNGNIADSAKDGHYDEAIYHEGFKRAEEELAKRLSDYLTKNQVDCGSARIWVMGHSRGAAVANLVAAELDEGHLGFDSERVYAYAFASPLCTRRKDAQDRRFANIFNVVNPEDFIPRLPLRTWGFKRFGRTLYLPCVATSYALYCRTYHEMQSTFFTLTDTDYEWFKGVDATTSFVRNATDLCPTLGDLYETPHFSWTGGLTFRDYFFLFTNDCAQHGLARREASAKLAERSEGAYAGLFSYLFEDQVLSPKIPFGHASEGYLAKVIVLDSLGVVPYEACDTRKFTVRGVGDLTVNDGSGIAVAKVVSGKMEQEPAGQPASLALWQDSQGASTSVWVPTDRTCSIELEAAKSGSGEVDCLWSDCDPEGAVMWQECYNALAVSDESMVRWDDLVAKGAAASVFKGGERRVDVSVVGDGDAVGVAGATAGDLVSVRAYHGPDVFFEGWFDHGRLVCPHRRYAFTLWENMELEARFKRL